MTAKTRRQKHQRSAAETWRVDLAAEDSAPPADPPQPDPADWGMTAEEARSMLGRQMCPVCSEGPWKSPLNHVARKHGIDRFMMRDICGLTLGVSVLDPGLHERFVERGREVDMSKVNHKGKPRAKQRWTKAGRDKNASTLASWEEANPEDALARRRENGREQGPDARRRQGQSLKEWWAEHPEARDAARKRLAEAMTPEERSVASREAWERRGLKPCGTRASYRRGCRCDECRAAHLAYRKAHG